MIENRNGHSIFDCWLNEYAPYGVQKLLNSCNPTQLNFFIIAHYLHTRICFRTRDLMHGSVSALVLCVLQNLRKGKNIIGQKYLLE